MKPLDYNGKNSRIARVLRKNMTKEEKKLWYDFLSGLNAGFKRQKPIGEYIVDFYSSKFSVIIEIDGSQHYSDVREKKDQVRDKYLTALGLKVLRYSNADINLRFKNVCDDILKQIGLLE